MEFKLFFELVGFQFIIASVSILLKCYCKSKHKGDYTPDNPLQPTWCSIISIISAILSLPVYVFLHLAHKHLADFYVQLYRQDQREINQKLHDSYYREGYTKGYNAGIAEGKWIGREIEKKD